MHIIASLSGNGFHPAAWRAGEAPAWPVGRRFQDMARTAERGKLDAVLLGEPVAGFALRASGQINGLVIDPLPLAGSLIAATQKIGLSAAWSVDFTEPYHVARVMATLDHLCGGRMAWTATLFDGVELREGFGHSGAVAHRLAYRRRANEFIDVVRKLWDSWEDRGFLLDVPTGRFADPDHVHPIHHAGEFFAVRGPLNLPRPPQGNPPVLMHDPGDSDDRLVVAKSADVVLIGSRDPADAAIQSGAIRAMAAQQARNPKHLRVLATLTPVIADTEQQAKALAAGLDARSSPAMIAALNERCGLRFSGTAAQLASLMAQWIETSACDGFDIRPARLPHDLDLFVDHVVPLLQQRELFRRGYDGMTLRDHFGLAHVESRYAEA